MKMAPGVFWGILLVIIGLSIIFRFVFDINLFRIIIAVFLILLGIKILLGDKGIFDFKSQKDDVIFGQKTIKTSPDNKSEYNAIFGKSEYDFRDIEFKDDKPVRVNVNVVFGSSVLMLSRDTPVKIKASSAFGGAKMPDGSTTAFGTSFYSSGNFSSESNYLYIEANVVFGGLEIITY
jgi:hypothetical protein